MEQGLLYAVVLGVIQGITEFAPVSSSGHLVVVPWLFGWPAPSLAFDTMLHLGSLVAVVVYFRVDLWRMAVGFAGRGKPETVKRYRWLGLMLLLATVPAAVIGYLFEDFFEKMFASPGVVGVFFLVTGAFLLASERLAPTGSAAEESAEGVTDAHVAEDVRPSDALAIGFAQSAAILPGISRSGFTIGAGMLRGLKREQAARFSFLLSIPIIMGAGVFQAKDLLDAGATGAPMGVMAAGFVASAVAGYLCIRFLLSYLKTRPLKVFAAYVFVIGVITIVVAVARGA